MSNDLTVLEKLMNAKLEAIREQQEKANQQWLSTITDIKEALNHLSQNMVRKDRFESKMNKVKDLEDLVKDQDERIDDVEHFQSVLKYIGGLIVLLIMAALSAWLTGLI